MQASIRCVVVGLVVACILIVATLCTSLAVWSGDRALSDTEKSRDDSVTAAFDAGQSNVLKVTEDYLNQVGDSTVRQLGSFWSSTENTVGSLCHQMMAEGDTAKTWPYILSLRAQLYHNTVSFWELDGMGVVTAKLQTLQLAETRETFARGVGEYHHYISVTNNGTDYDSTSTLPAQLRTYVGDVIAGTGATYGWPDMAQEDPAYPACYGSGASAIGSDGKTLDAPCRFGNYDLAGVHLRAFNATPIGVSTFLRLSALKNYVGMVTQCVYGNPVTKERYGVVYGGSDVAKITLFLKSLDLGHERGSLARVFAVVRNDWLSVDNEHFGYLAGTSHGSSLEEIPVTQRVGGTSVRPIRASNCSDSLVSSTATRLEGTGVFNGTTLVLYEGYVRQKGHQTIRLVTPRAPHGEDFFAKVQVFDNSRGLNWYVVSLIDREYILGQVDVVNRATQQAIDDSEEQVDSDLTEARIILYCVVVGAAIIPIAFAAFLVFRITEPLMRLKADMSNVAVMALDLVEGSRPASSLSEVNQMETAFNQMLKNLLEYRQYLPQSVLVDTTDVSDEARSTSRRTTEQGSTSQSAHGSEVASVSSFRDSRHGIATKHYNLFDATIRQRSISILVTNIKGVIRMRDATLVESLTHYLEPFVQSSRMFRGVVDDFCGDRVAVSFNTTIAAAYHKTKCIEFAVHLQTKWDQVETNMSLATGTALCGNVGCTGLKKYAMFGAVACNVRAYERCGRAWGVPILADAGVASEGKDRFIMRKICAVVTKSGKDTILTEVVKPKPVSNEEWMYQLEAAAATDPFRSLNSAVVNIYSGDLDLARDLLMSSDAPGTDIARGLLIEALRRGAPPAPLRIFDVPALSQSSTQSS